MAQGGAQRGNIAVLAHAFPAVSETFVLDHLVGLERAGWDPVLLAPHLDLEALARARARTGARLRVEPLTPALRSLPALARATAGAARAARRAPRLLPRAAGRSLLLRAGNLRGHLSRLRPRAVHAHYADNGVAAALAVRGEVPLLVDFHGWDFNVFPSEVGWPALADALRGAHLIAHSEFARGRIRAGTGLEASLVRLGVDLEGFGAGERAGTWPVEPRWLVVGRLTPAKGQEVALRALAAASPHAHLALVGAGPDEARLRALAGSLGLGDRVRFAGPLDTAGVAREMREADVLLVPSVIDARGTEEAFGRVVLEGLASGLLVVASRVGGLAEALGDAGVIVPPGDADALAAAVAEGVTARSPRAWQDVATERARQWPLEHMWSDYDGVLREACRCASSS